MTESNWQAQSRVHTVEVGRPTGWTAWVTFAAVMLSLVGLFHVMAGFAALFQDQTFVARSADLLISVSYDTWGWVHIVLGIVGIVTAYLLMQGNMLGRVLGVVIAALSALANLGFLAAQPVWALLIIGVDVLVIFGITVHGGELKSNR